MALTDEPVSPYRIYVMASNVIDLITVAGGWLADRAMAGWDATVFVADYRDDRSLQILGIDGVPFQSALDLRDLEVVHSLAIAPDIYGQEARIRTRVARAVVLGEPEVIFLGESYPPAVRGKPHKVEHQCSRAAVAFKRQALSAAGAPADTVSDREVHFSWPMRRKVPVDYTAHWRRKPLRQPPTLALAPRQGLSSPPA